MILLWLCQPSPGGAVLKSGLKVVAEAAAAAALFYAEWMVVSLSPASAEDRSAPLHALYVLYPLSFPVLPLFLQEGPFGSGFCSISGQILPWTVRVDYRDGWMRECGRLMCVTCSCVSLVNCLLLCCRDGSEGKPCDEAMEATPTDTATGREGRGAQPACRSPTRQTSDIMATPRNAKAAGEEVWKRTDKIVRAGPSPSVLARSARAGCARVRAHPLTM